MLLSEIQSLIPKLCSIFINYKVKIGHEKFFKILKFFNQFNLIKVVKYLHKMKRFLNVSNHKGI